MTEVCFCGWFGDMADKVPVTVDESSSALCCPHCGRVDALNWLPINARSALLQEARERRILREIVAGVAA